MSILQQLNNYLSQPPDSFVYHIVTLLALQAALGLAWWQVRRRPEDDFARRLAWASGIILLSRLFILLAIFATTELVDAIALLPPLERAVDALTVAVLTWALAPQPKSFPRLGSALLLIAIIVIVFLYIAFAGEWQSLVDSGLAQAGYADTQQAAVWSILQMAMLIIGGALVIYALESQWSLRLALLLVLLISQGVSLAFGSKYGPSNVEVSFWTRLGNVVVFPMLAVLTYRHNLQKLLPAIRLAQTGSQQTVRSLDFSSIVSSSLQPEQTLGAALTMALGLLPARFGAIVRINAEHPQYLDITTSTDGGQLPDHNNYRSKRAWRMKRDSWPGLSHVLNGGQQLELRSEGPGARQFHELHRTLKLDEEGELLLQPLISGEKEIGLLLLASIPSRATWSEEQKSLANALGPFLAHSLHSAGRYQLALAGQAPDFEYALAELREDLGQTARQRDEALEQVTQLSSQLSVARKRLDVDNRKLRETTQALALAVQRQTKVRQLEDELAGLREALSEAELALANAAAGEAGLSTEWVMRTVTRYSGELEEAQAQIGALEERLKQPDQRELLEHAASISGHLRTPLTALGGYTDLLLDQASGQISPQQESLLRRMRVNVDNMAQTVDALSVTSRSLPADQIGAAPIDVHEALEEAIYAVSPELQARKLRVDMYVEDNLPVLEDPGNSLAELLVKLLGAACLVAATNGRLHIDARRVPGNDEDGKAARQARFIRVSISDDGGAASHAHYASAILEQSTSTGSRSLSGASKLANCLDSVAQITSSRGGRSWLDLANAKGSTLILLLPVPVVASDTSS